MKFTVIVKRPVEVEITTLRMSLPVSDHGEDDDMPRDFPFRDGDAWTVDIDLDTHRIKDWPSGRSAHLFMKVVDNGTYTLLGPTGNVVAKRESYAPNKLVPGEYGDYVELIIDYDGTIRNWPEDPDPSEIMGDNDDE